jgi:hypothetical protein
VWQVSGMPRARAGPLRAGRRLRARHEALVQRRPLKRRSSLKDVVSRERERHATAHGARGQLRSRHRATSQQSMGGNFAAGAGPAPNGSAQTARLAFAAQTTARMSRAFLRLWFTTNPTNPGWGRARSIFSIQRFFLARRCANVCAGERAYMGGGWVARCTLGGAKSWYPCGVARPLP